MTYCARCRIGALDEKGVCLLCGASAIPPTRGQRVAEAGGDLLALLLNPAIVGTVVLVFLLLAVARVTHDGTHVPAGVPRVSLPNPGATFALAQTNPTEALLHFLLPALLQALLFALLLALVFAFLRRRRSAPTDGPQHQT